MCDDGGGLGGVLDSSEGDVDNRDEHVVLSESTKAHTIGKFDSGGYSVFEHLLAGCGVYMHMRRNDTPLVCRQEVMHHDLRPYEIDIILMKRIDR